MKRWDCHYSNYGNKYCIHHLVAEITLLLVCQHECIVLYLDLYIYVQ